MIQGIGMLPLVGAFGCTASDATNPLASASLPPSDVSNFLLTAPDGREVEVTQFMPSGERRGTILFSHGSGSSPGEYPGMLDVWAGAGWQVLAPLHVDSRKHPHTSDYPGLASWRTRIEDMRLLSDHIGDTPYVAAGHSYGALTALTLGGAKGVPPEGIEGPLRDPKARAVVAFSPPPPIPVLMTREGYAQLAVPALIQTGTADEAAAETQGVDAWRGHLVPYEAAEPGNHRYALVLEDVDHYFGGIICDYSQPGPPQREKLDTAVSLASLFIEAYGRDEDHAKAALASQLSGDLPVMLLRK